MVLDSVRTSGPGKVVAEAGELAVAVGGRGGRGLL